MDGASPPAPQPHPEEPVKETSDFESIRILVADAHRLVAEALHTSLGYYPEFSMLEDIALSGHELVEAARVGRPDIILLDYWIPGMEATSATRLILSEAPDCKVILLSWLNVPDYVQEVFDSGAVGFLPKSVTMAELVEAIHRAVAGECPLFADKIERIAGKVHGRLKEADDVWDRLSSLTAREIEILRLLDRGRLPEEAARDLGIQKSTLRNHLHNILEKVGARTQMQALAMARHYGLLRS